MHLLKKIITASLAAGALIWGTAHAEWPHDKPLTIVVPFPAGGVTDQLARLLSNELSTSLGQSVIVQNRPGAGGLLGVRIAAQAPADGYTLLLSQIASHGSLPALYNDLGYDPIKSFAPVILLTAHPNVLVANPKLPVKNVSELIAMAKAKPGVLNYASAGVGTTFFLSAELLKTVGNVSITGIHYKGGAPAVMATLSGETDIVFSDFATALVHVQKGTLHALGVTSKERSPVLPDVPAIAETPGLENFEVVSWISLHFPAGVPDSVVHRVNAESNKALKSQAIRQWLANSGGVAKGGSPEDLSRHVDAELAKWKEVIERAGIKRQ